MFQPDCIPTEHYAVSVMDFIYVLCVSQGYHVITVQAYDVSSPHDLLMITVADEIYAPYWSSDTVSMVGFNNTNTLYVNYRSSFCIWKIDLVNNRIGKWLSTGYEVHLSVANDNHLLVVDVSDGDCHLHIYDEDGNHVSSVPLSNDFRHPFVVIQKPNGDLIVSHRSREDNNMCVSFLNIEGKVSGQFKLKDTVGFRDAHCLYSFGLHAPLAIETFSGKVYILNYNTFEWNLTDYGVIFNNGTREIVGVQSTNGRTFTEMGILDNNWCTQFADLFLSTSGRYLVVAESIFGDLYQFDTKTLKWRQIGLHVGRIKTRNWYYSATKNQFIASFPREVSFLAFLSVL